MSYDFLVLSYNGSIKVEDYLTICLYLGVPLSRCLSALVFIFWCNRGVCFYPPAVRPPWTRTYNAKKFCLPPVKPVIGLQDCNWLQSGRCQGHRGEDWFAWPPWKHHSRRVHSSSSRAWCLLLRPNWGVILMLRLAKLLLSRGGHLTNLGGKIELGNMFQVKPV